MQTSCKLAVSLEARMIKKMKRKEKKKACSLRMNPGLLFCVAQGFWEELPDEASLGSLFSVELT